MYHLIEIGFFFTAFHLFGTINLCPFFSEIRLKNYHELIEIFS